jgi:small subunit ribosomal protein S20
VANSKQQRKRVRIAERQRLENRRYRTQIKTLFRRLREATDAGESEADGAYRRLVAIVDRAAARKAIHRNTAARKKRQAALIRDRARERSAA